MLELEGSSLVYSILKTPEDGAENTLILRLWNASEKTQEGSVTTGFDLQEAFAVSLEETAPVSVPFTDRRIPLTVGPWKIVTLRLVKKSLSV